MPAPQQSPESQSHAQLLLMSLHLPFPRKSALPPQVGTAQTNAELVGLVVDIGCVVFVVIVALWSGSRQHEPSAWVSVHTE